MVVILLTQTLAPISAQDDPPTGTCNTALGLSSGGIPDDSIKSTTQTMTGFPSSDLQEERFVSGFATQGPPEKVRPMSIPPGGVCPYLTMDAPKGIWGPSFKRRNNWTGYQIFFQKLFNFTLLFPQFFDTDTKDAKDVITYFGIHSIVLARYVKINVTKQVSGLEIICLRFELYGCNTDVQPMTGMKAITTPKGKIEVSWNTPTADNTLEFDNPSGGQFKPSGYVVLYKPVGAQAFESVTTEDMNLSLDDVRLGAAYDIHLQCLVKDVSIKCGSTEVEAYPPCPAAWTGGNEYHCFLYLSGVTSFDEARKECLNMDVDEKLGDLSYLIDEQEGKFLSSRILPDDVSSLWLVGNACKDNEDCCKILNREGEFLRETGCEGEELESAVCLRDHKGEGSRLRISTVKASNDGKAVFVTWRYEGIGWKTDKLQVKLWTDNKDNPKVLTFSTLEQVFNVKDLEPGIMYSILLRPAPNIRTEELTYQFVIISFTEDGTFGALLTPIRMSVYVIWSGTLRVTWDEAQAFSESGAAKKSDKYSISHQMEALDEKKVESIIEFDREYHLTPISMKTEYTFRLGCSFADKFHNCGVASVRTDPPTHIDRDSSGLLTMYEVINETHLDWFTAEEDCQQRSGHLTSVLSEDEGKTLLKVLPARDAKLWTGAKLKAVNNGTSYWTDGNKITYLPMSKNSGVLPSKDSCCRALNEAGRLKLAGGPCTDELPYACKYLFRDIMEMPSSLSTISQEWDSFEIGWKSPEKGWLPTFYNVKVCSKEAAPDCRDHNELRNQLNFAAEQLAEFTAYDITVQAVLQPVDVITSAKTTVYTYPKSAVRYSISSTGELSVETPMLVAMGMESASVSATLYRDDKEAMSATGDVKRIVLEKLIPDESYELMVKDLGSSWEHRLSFTAVPTCVPADYGTDGFCYRLVKSDENFEAAKLNCASLKVGETAESMILWTPDSPESAQAILEKLGSDFDVWLDNPGNEATDAECSLKEGDNFCSWYDAEKKEIVSSYCCDKSLAFVCSYQTKATLGQVTDLFASSIGNSSFAIQWRSPPAVLWDIRRYHVEWRSTELDDAPMEAKIVEESTQILLEGLEYGTEYEIVVTPLGAKSARGESEKLLVTTLDPRPQLSIVVSPDGVTRISSDILIAKGRGDQDVDVAILKKDPEKTPVFVVRGKAEEVNVTGLEPGGEYWVEMMPVSGKPFNYRGSFKAYPSCEKGQIQDGPVCVWAAPVSKGPREAVEICKRNNGELLDYRTQKELTPVAKAMLATHVKTHFWMDISESSTSAALTDGTSDDCSNTANSDIMCCTFEVTSTGELDELKCECCDEPRPFACKTEAKVDLGNIGKITLEDTTSRSVTLGWELLSSANWQKPSFLVTWEVTEERRRKRAVDNQVVVKETKATINDLKPDTSYKVAVAPYSDTTQVSGSPKVVNITTAEDVKAGGIVAEKCTITILKISCSITVIIGSFFTIFVLIATRMFYLDCLAQIFAEISILGAYLCILISSAQSYSVDNECVKASPTLCVAVAALIQFFFQSTFLFIYLESFLMCGVLKDYLPLCCAPRSPLTLMIIGFGIPALMNIVLAAIASDEYSDGNDNCWLYLQGRAMLPSVVPVIVFGVLALFLLLSVFDADEPRGRLTPTHVLRGRVFLKTRWVCFAILTLVSVSYSTGMIGANDRDSTLNYVFVGFSTALGILMPLLRIRCDDQVKAQLKRGLFASFRDDLGGIRVTPAPENPLLKMAEFDNPKYKQQQLANLAYKNKENLVDSDTVWHR
ncbi:Adhesion G protein-coupled receptor L3 like protein [Argiope bruennichi]|uniref:Adhesion G protein-coupled receptor L3 like protein n=1 Tax=Argiope bruennichi TaxID=94029 RepID=A0A8T0EV32_ARGBR|nr:Adhesion G protein-coupled receptor L3 like protein [Argiope bruennichi]